MAFQPALAQNLQPVPERLTVQPPSVEALEQIGGIKAYRNTPLGDRTPLVLVHGIGGAESRYYHWENLLEEMDKHPAFNDRYKVYFYHYDSTRSVPNISSDLQNELKRFIGGNNRPIKILAYSEGGLLVRNAMEDPYVNHNTLSVLAIATPFHGSPLANPEWLRKQVEAEPGLSVMRLTQKMVYDITGRKYPTFREDFGWDNFDSAIPAEQYSRHHRPATLKDYALEDKENFITYGSYFGMDVDPQGSLPKALNVTVPLPREEMKFGNIFRKNFLFSMVRNNIGKLPVAAFKKAPEPSVATATISPQAEIASSLEAVAPDAPMEEVLLDPQSYAVSMVSPEKASALPVPAVAGVIIHAEDEGQEVPAVHLPMAMSIMAFNDGISPISSTLWLGRYTPNFKSVKDPAERVWAALKSLKGSKNARLFAGLDHRNWMDGVSRTDEAKMVDLLNPDEPPKTVFEWIIFDLMG